MKACLQARASSSLTIAMPSIHERTNISAGSGKTSSRDVDLLVNSAR